MTNLESYLIAAPKKSFQGSIFFNIPQTISTIEDKYAFCTPFRQVCVFTAPLFSAFCALSAYGLVNEVRGQGAGLAAAAFVGAVPSYISRSVAGSFDNEAVAIFALVCTFFTYIKVRADAELMSFLVCSSKEHEEHLKLILRLCRIN